MEKQNDKTFKILSIDGGGIKGLYSLHILSQLEKKFCKKDETLSDYFDMICGTSTGGIIAMGIASGFTTSHMTNIYEKNANDVFPGHNGSYFSNKISHALRFFSSLAGYRYNQTALQKIANECFGNKKMNQSKNLLCIPSFDIGNGINTVFKFPHKEGNFMRDQHILMTDVAMATSAAQTYFPLHYFTSPNMNSYFVDGGMWANNPSMIGLTEALRFFVGKDKEYDKYEILSIGNINENTAYVPNSKYYFWNIFKMPYLISTFFNSNSQSIHQYCRTICDCTNGLYKRIECVNPTYTNNGEIEMDNSSAQFLDYMKSNATRMMVNMLTPGNKEYDKSIEKFFENKKTYVTN